MCALTRLFILSHLEVFIPIEYAKIYVLNVRTHTYIKDIEEFDLRTLKYSKWQRSGGGDGNGDIVSHNLATISQLRDSQHNSLSLRFTLSSIS